MSITDERRNGDKDELTLFKGATKHLVEKALKLVEEMEGMCELCGEVPLLMEKYQLLRHYLDYLNRMCEGKA